jgi:predicted DNA-binding protein (UPF0251 family)
VKKRLITEREEQAYRLCHPDFDGLPIDQAVTKMGISRKAILWLLNSVRHKAPQLPPVLTPRQQLILMLAGDKGQTPEQIAASTGLSAQYVRQVIARLEAAAFVMPKVETLQYTTGMDAGLKYGVNKHLRRTHYEKVAERF